MKKVCLYYLLKGNLYEIGPKSSDDTGFNKASLINHGAVKVIKIQNKGDHLKFDRFEGWTENLEKQAILMFFDMDDYDESSVIRLSDELISRVAVHVDEAIQKILKKYSSYSSEDMVTAALGDRLSEEFESTDIKFNIKFQAYSSVVKEPINGADISFIFDIRDRDGNRLIKTILIQSKKVKNINKKIENVPRLVEQIEKMNAITKENFVFYYNEKEFSSFKSSDPNIRIPISSLFSEVLRCRNGDKRKATLASSLDSKRIICTQISE